MFRAKFGFLAVLLLAGVALAAPASSSAQVDVEEACHALVGSEEHVVMVGPVGVGLWTCREADDPDVCEPEDTLDLMVIRVDHKVCLSLERLLEEQRVGVEGLAEALIFQPEP